MGITSTINQFNSQFPLVKHAALSGESHSFQQLKAERRFPLGSSEKSGDRYTKCTLGVYNAYPLKYDTTRMIPLDPLCLFSLLTLSAKMGPGLPEKSKQEGDSAMMVVSYSAAFDGQLPILIEDDVRKTGKKVKRKIRTAEVVNKFALAGITDPHETMYVQLIDTRLFDFYIEALVGTKEHKSLVMDLYSLPVQQKSAAETLQYSSVASHLASRFHFALRNPSISAEVSGRSISSWVQPKYHRVMVQEEHERCLEEGVELLREFERLFSDCDTQFFFDSEPSAFDYKLAAMVYCIDALSDEVEEFTVIQKCPLLLEHCEEVMTSLI